MRSLVTRGIGITLALCLVAVASTAEAQKKKPKPQQSTQQGAPADADADQGGGKGPAKAVDTGPATAGQPTEAAAQAKRLYESEKWWDACQALYRVSTG